MFVHNNKRTSNHAYLGSKLSTYAFIAYLLIINGKISISCSNVMTEKAEHLDVFLLSQILIMDCHLDGHSTALRCFQCTTQRH